MFASLSLFSFLLFCLPAGFSSFCSETFFCKGLAFLPAVTGYRDVPVLGQGPIEHRVRARSIVHVIDLGPTSGRIDDVIIPAEFYRMIRVLVSANP